MGSKKDLNLEDILTDKSSENDLLEVPLTGKIFHTFSLLTFIVLLVILVQFFNISIFKSKIYKRSAFTNITNTKIEIAPRGLILDRFGESIVKNEASFRVFLSIRDFPKEFSKRDFIFNRLSKILEIQLNEIIDKIKNHDWKLGDLLLKKDISHEKLVILSSENLQGINIKSGFSRVSEDSKAFTHVVGYTGLVDKYDLDKNSNLFFQDEIGKMGLEFQYDQLLRGQNGKEITYMDANMGIKDKQILAQPKIGETLKTYIDSDFQKYFYNRLVEQVKKLNAKAAVGIAINPQNGEVLALTNIPSFDLNNPVLYLDKINQPFFNRAVAGLYSPGSTIKSLVAIAALEEGIVTPEKQFLSTGRIVVPNPYNSKEPSVFKDWKAHGWVNLRSALARSSNVYFYTIGGGFGEQEGLGISKLNNWWKKFNLNKKTEIDLPDEKTGFLPSIEWKENKYKEPWRIGDTYNVSIGQGQLLLTPLELINYISVIANGGNIYKLRISQTQKKEVIKNINEDLKKSLDEVRKGMKDVVDKEYGTAYYLNTLPFDVAAKTGTAQTNNHKTNAFFVGYAPYENPEIAVLILIEDSAEGGLNSVPVANDVLYWYYKNRIIDQKDISE